MRILSITAGAAGMYCGSCARDNALARELLNRGHDVTLVPVYTPTRTDEPNVSQHRVLFGGISVYLQQYVGLFRRLPRFLDRLWDSPKVIAAFAGRMVSNDPKMLGELTLSMLQGEGGVLRREFEKLLDWIQRESLPDVINLPNSLLISLAKPLRREVNRPVVCTLQGEELFIEGLVEPYRAKALDLIRNSVAHVDRFIAVSDFCARYMGDYLKIPKDKISVVPLGINMQGYELRESAPLPDRGFSIGYFARIAPEKGLHVLAEAYIRLRQKSGDSRTRLEAAGYVSPAHVSYLNDVKRLLRNSGLESEFTYHGVVDRNHKLSFLTGLDVLSVPATYDEPKGMFLLEAMACGVPVVQPRRGAFIEIVEKTGGGILVSPDDPDALADAFQRLMRDRAAAVQLGRNGFQNVRNHYSIEASATRLLSVYEAVLSATPVG